MFLPLTRLVFPSSIHLCVDFDIIPQNFYTAYLFHNIHPYQNKPVHCQVAAAACPPGNRYHKDEDFR